jgi:hypothetical protein
MTYKEQSYKGLNMRFMYTSANPGQPSTILMMIWLEWKFSKACSISSDFNHAASEAIAS